MSRNGKNFKNAPANFLLKTMYKQSPNNNNDFNFSPLNVKNNANITTSEYLSFYTNESENISNKKNLNQNKINYLFKNYTINKEKNKISHSKKMLSNNSKTKNLILNKTNIKRSSSTSKTNSNSLNISNNISKKFKIKEKKTNKILKLFIKEGEKNSSKTKKNITNNSKKLIKNKSNNNIYMTCDKNIFNIKKITKINNISNLHSKNNNKINNNFNHIHPNKNHQNYNSNTGANSLIHNSKNKIKNLSITINKLDNNNINSSKNVYNINTYTNSNVNKTIHKKINMHKTCINTPIESFRKAEQIIKLNKEIESKENEIKNLKYIINEKDLYIKNLEDKISSLNVNKNVDEEYDKYSKIIMLKNVKNLTSENEELHKQIKEHKNKEIKLMKLLENINKKGIDINNILNMFDNVQNNDINISDINNSNLNTNERIIKYDEIVLKTDTTNNTNNTNNTFVPLNLNDEQKNISSKSCINLNQNLPVLPLKNINEYYNDNYYAQKENDNIQIQITNNYDCNIIRNNLENK